MRSSQNDGTSKMDIELPKSFSHRVSILPLQGFLRFNIVYLAIVRGRD